MRLQMPDEYEDIKLWAVGRFEPLTYRSTMIQDLEITFDAFKRKLSARNYRKHVKAESEYIKTKRRELIRGAQGLDVESPTPRYAMHSFGIAEDDVFHFEDTWELEGRAPRRFGEDPALTLSPTPVLGGGQVTGRSCY
jgi:hypothetical protein